MPIVAKSNIEDSNTYPRFNNSVPHPSSIAMSSLDQFVSLAKLRKVRKGEFVYTQTEDISSIYVVKSGSVKLGTHAVTGKEITKAFLMQGDLFSEKAVLGQKLNKEYAMARELTEVYEFRIDTIQRLIKEYPSLLHYLINIIGQRAIAMERRLESLVFNDSKTRVIDFLLDLAARRGRPVGYETLINNVLTHQEIANYTATSRQTVTTILNELRTGNILTFNRRRLLIRDLGKLAQAK